MSTRMYLNIKLYRHVLGLLFVMLPMICSSLPAMAGSSFSNIRELHTKESREILENVAIWFIEDGLAEYYKGRDLNYIEENVKERGAYLRGDAVIEKYGYLAELVPELSWVRSTVTCYVRLDNDFIYEYWVIDRFGGTRKDIDREIYFLIAKTKGLDKKRQIIHRSTKFSPEFTTSEGIVIRFPTDDNRWVYQLKPWMYPEAFKGTELEGIEVVVKKDGEYVRKQRK